ncbi:putative tyrosine/serine protein phosphatase [Aspergillus lucknowensis]|uniref:Protein-tyrosine phosphatase-like protein n=1 Tax=Aspergillus lucknowensis TaxID=176173 RepID=A0ABR4LJ54_9EURO
MPTTHSSNPDRPFDSIINFRDVGRTINQMAGKRLLKEGVLFRSARLDEASDEDIRHLTGNLNVSTILDLRSTTEHRMAITKYRKTHPAPSPEENPGGQGEEEYIHLPPLEDTKATRHLISLTGRAFEMRLLWRLDWWNFTKLLAYLAAGYRQDAVRIIGENVMKPAGLTGLAMDTLEASTAELKEVFDLLGSRELPSSPSPPSPSSSPGANDSTGGVLVHCTQGKDRTGLVILLLLLLTGVVEGSAIAREYVRSEKELERVSAEEKEERMREIRALGLGEEYTRCPVDFTEGVTRFLEERYGGVRGYLRFAGVEDGVIEAVRRRFVA